MFPKNTIVVVLQQWSKTFTSQSINKTFTGIKHLLDTVCFALITPKTIFENILGVTKRSLVVRFLKILSIFYSTGYCIISDIKISRS